MELHGIDPSEGLMELTQRKGEKCLRTEDILREINNNRDSIALVMLSGIQYYTGQKFDMEKITKFTKDRGIPIGWDLAHAVGNVELKLHDWGVDFGVWCTYKYMNSGAGGVGGIFLHHKFSENPPKHLMGWWSNETKSRFLMNRNVQPALGADSFRLSNPPPFLACLNYASLEVYNILYKN